MKVYSEIKIPNKCWFTVPSILGAFVGRSNGGQTQNWILLKNGTLSEAKINADSVYRC